jgi:hypothetical protein
MRTWRLVVIAAVLFATAFLLHRWWQQTSSRADRRAHRTDEPDESEPQAATGSRSLASGHGGAGAQPGDAPASPKLDRALADRMREQIRALLAEAGPMVAGADPGAKPPTAPSFGTMPQLVQPDGSTNVDPDYLRSVMHSDFFPLAKDCYVTALGKNPSLAGRIELHFEIIGDRKVGGVVDEAKFLEGTTIDDREFQTCVRESMLSVSFAAPPNDGSLTVTYPIVFSPDEPEGGAGD